MMGSTHTTAHVMTLANSIIGVAILAMPFCFQKCGILLSIVLLIIINITTRVCCHYLVKSSILCRRRTMEIMALQVFGPSGKLMVELCTIGYLMGTCVAYFVVVGDLGPQIISKTFDIAHTDSLRVWIMLLVTALCVVPLGMLKNVDSLSTVCTASIGFYFCLVVKVMAEAREHILSGEWLNEVHYWRWSGVLQCLPIFSLSLSCQIVIFEVFETVSNATLSRMNDIVRSAISMCTCVYVAVGFFGYVAFFKQEFSGNILLNLQPSMTSDIIQMGFVMSVACSFPLVIFPCRASLYSLLYQRDHSEVAHYIPEHRFRYITLTIIVLALIIGILTPSIELIIGLVGSTIGVAICIMFPATCFIRLGKRDSSELLLAKVLVVFGFFLMVLGTYANLAAFEDRTSGVQFPSDGKHQHNVLPIEVVLTATEKVPDVVVPESLQSLRPQEPIAKKSVTLEVEQPNRSDNGADEALLVNQKTESVRIIPLPVEQHQTPPRAPKTADPGIGRDAIAHEEHEIAIEEKSQIAEQLGELKKTKELVQEIKDELAKQNEKTQQLVLQKFEQIVDKVEHIEKVQEEVVAKSQQALDKEEKLVPLDVTSEKVKPVPEVVAKSLPKNQTTLASDAAIAPPQLKAIKTDDPIINMIQNTVKAKAEVEPSKIIEAPAIPAAVNAGEIVQEIALQAVNQSESAPVERVARDLLAVGVD